MERREKYPAYLTLHISIENLVFLPAYFPIVHSSRLHKNVDSDNHMINFASDKSFRLADILRCCMERNTVVEREGGSI
jgi:hypothetical protein